MRIGLHDSERNKYPNLALMKLSAWHKAQGHSVKWYSQFDSFDKVYSSKVFTWTASDPYLPRNTIYGGTGSDITTVLPEAVEHICPDYSLYGINYSMGFLTRGCIRKCPWCFVPEKEGELRANADVEDFAVHKDVVLMDNNVLAHPHGIAQIGKIARLGLKVDFNQGLDARLIDNEIAKLLGSVNWLHPVRLACDTAASIESVRKAVELLRWHNVTPRRYFCYVLVDNVEDALERIRFLKGMDVDPFVQPFRSKTGSAATTEQKALARWANHKAEFKSRTWDAYKLQHVGT